MITELLPDTRALPSDNSRKTNFLLGSIPAHAKWQPAIQSVEPNHLPEAEVPIQAEQLIVVCFNEVSSSLRHLSVRGLWLL